MNTVTPSPVAVKPLQFAVGTSIPYIWGAQDAAAGLPCVPEMHWVRNCDQIEYAAGYESVTGPTLTTGQFLGSN